MNAQFAAEKFPLREETYLITGIAMEVHRILGKGFSEVVYKDALEYEFKQNNIPFKREQQLTVSYRDIILPHYFFADFVMYEKIILEIKCKSRLIEEHYSQVLNYLAISKLRVGLIFNFSEPSLIHKRIIL